MKLATLILLLHHSLAQFYNHALAELMKDKKCAIDNRSTENMWELKIVEDLLKCGYYNAFEPPPINGTEALEVEVFFILKSFKFNSELQEFSAYTWTIIYWKDDRLKWDPEKYDGITQVIATTLEVLWAPGLRLINSIGDYYDERYIFIPCELNSDGTVRCILVTTYEAKCSTDLRDWPYDAQNCNLQFGLFKEKAMNMTLRSARKSISMIGAEYGTEWDIMDYEQAMSNSSEVQLMMKFRLERHAGVLSAIVIYPAIILSVLTLSSLFIDARLNLRLIVICFSLFCHNYFITDLSFEIPENTKDPPRLLMYYRGSLILTSVLIVLTFVLNTMCRSNVICPNWITSINDFVLTKFLKFTILPRWETTMKKDVSESNFVKDWTDFANIVNSVGIFVSVIVYICLYCVFMPQPIPFN